MIAAFVLTFLLYLAALYPSIAPRDSADMAVAAMTLGVAHPPGYPLYAALGRAWLAIFPFGNPAYRLNVLSALAGAGAVAVLFAVARRRGGWRAGLAAAAAWGLSASLWKFSLLEEKYALHALFAAALLLFSEGTDASLFARARLSGFLAGLGLVNHQSLIFWIPGLLWLWSHEARSRSVRRPRLLAAAALPFAAGLSFFAFLWIRLGRLDVAAATALRLRYGSGTLFAGMARPWSAGGAASLLAYSLREAASGIGWPAAAAAAAGAVLAWLADRRRAAAWLAAAALAGPGFIAASRFDPANWIARSVLEPAFILPSLVLAAFAGEALGSLPAASSLAAILLLGCGALLRAPLPEHRDDFLAYDYAQDLRRAVPPGGALLVSGDTASFALRWLSLVRPEGRPRELGDARLIDDRSWLAARAARPDVFTTGAGLADLRAWGLLSAGAPLAPAGLVQRVGAAPPAPAPLSVLRRGRSWRRDESYARDAKLSYAYAAWSSARILQAQGIEPPETLDLTAVSIDPEDYRLR